MRPNEYCGSHWLIHLFDIEFQNNYNVEKLFRQWFFTAETQILGHQTWILCHHVSSSEWHKPSRRYADPILLTPPTLESCLPECPPPRHRNVLWELFGHCLNSTSKRRDFCFVFYQCRTWNHPNPNDSITKYWQRPKNILENILARLASNFHF